MKITIVIYLHGDVWSLQKFNYFTETLLQKYYEEFNSHKLCLHTKTQIIRTSKLPVLTKIRKYES